MCENGTSTHTQTNLYTYKEYGQTDRALRISQDYINKNAQFLLRIEKTEYVEKMTIYFVTL